ncbi:MAG: hypothetical protein BWZ10_00049 [candidate division BRC1 bacterium ADurb.BinA364]|nr:MAG: hypothetical protein BWZ10_00049 [candidate division BRC1 bacterium ADurb.BinA364]
MARWRSATCACGLWRCRVRHRSRNVPGRRSARRSTPKCWPIASTATGRFCRKSSKASARRNPRIWRRSKHCLSKRSRTPPPCATSSSSHAACCAASARRDRFPPWPTCCPTRHCRTWRGSRCKAWPRPRPERRCGRRLASWKANCWQALSALWPSARTARPPRRSRICLPRKAPQSKPKPCARWAVSAD